MWILRKVTWLQLTLYYSTFEGRKQVTRLRRVVTERLGKAASREVDLPLVSCWL
jgi:hypothetical protein